MSSGACHSQNGTANIANKRNKRNRPPGTGPRAPRTAASEDDYNRWFCTLVNGETATRHGYTSAGDRGYVEVDCETGTLVYEGGLDKRSRLDSVQQALFFSHVTGKPKR